MLVPISSGLLLAATAFAHPFELVKRDGCPGFRNTVFNTAASKAVGFPQTVWASLQANNVDDWIGFAVNTLDKEKVYDNIPVTTSLNQRQIHMVPDPTRIGDAMDLLKTNPPKYLQLLNEPDFSFGGFTPLTSPQDAATALAPFFAMDHPHTKYMAPAVAFTSSDWLTKFRDACNGCFSQIPVIPAHVYTTDAGAIRDAIVTLHETFPDQRIWVTELSPTASGCTLDEAGMITFMQTVVADLRALPYVDKIFWNCGEHGKGMDGGDPGTCNPSLTNADGSISPLGVAYGKVCES